MDKSIHHKSAFTLAELLVVIAIITVLLGILLPSLSHARENARATSCMSNLRHWGNGLNYYLAEWNQYLPQEGYVSNPAGNQLAGAWYNALPALLSAPKYGEVYDGVTSLGLDGASNATTGISYRPTWIAYCPTKTAQRRNSASGKNSFHYTMNAVLNGSSSYGPDYGNAPTNQDFTRLLSIPLPTAAVFLMESDSNQPCNSPAAAGVARQRHFGNALNFLFLDLHVESFNGAQVADPASSPPASGQPWQTLNPLMVWGPFKN